MTDQRQPPEATEATAAADPIRDDMLCILRAAGHDVPGDRVDVLLAGYVELKAMRDLLRQPRTAASEPANTYALATIMRSV